MTAVVMSMRCILPHLIDTFVTDNTKIYNAKSLCYSELRAVFEPRQLLR